MIGIEEMFAELSGYDAYEHELAARWLVRHLNNYQNVKRWRKANPEKFRLARKRWTYDWGKRHPDRARAAKARYVDANRDKMRAVWRINQRAKRARDRASKAAA